MGMVRGISRIRLVILSFVLAATFAACVPRVQAPPPLAPPHVAVETRSILAEPAAAQETLEPTAVAVAPQIQRVDFPQTVPEGEDGVGSVAFSDPQGDIFWAQFIRANISCAATGTFTFDPMPYIITGDKFSGIFEFHQTCAACPDGEVGEIEMEVRLLDEAGNASQGVRYDFICE